MPKRFFQTILILSTLALLAFVLAVEFWPGNGPQPDEVVATYMQRLQDGDEIGALALWRLSTADAGETGGVGALSALQLATDSPEPVRSATGEEALDLTIELADTLHGFQLEPPTYWTSCCELRPLEDGKDAFVAQVRAQVIQHPAQCGLPLDQIPPEDLRASTLVFHLVDNAHDSIAYNWGLPWERWLARPRGRQEWRIAAVDWEATGG